MSDLHRKLAPITDAAWREIDAEAARVLRTSLAARRLVDFIGPLGWQASAVHLGRTEAPVKADAVEIARRKVLPLSEFRVDFALKRSEVSAIDRGARDADLGAVQEAAQAIALAEDRAIFNGSAPAGIEGIIPAATNAALRIEPDYVNYPSVVARALTVLRNEGIGGKIGLALGPRCFTGLSETTVGGYPVLEHVRRLVEGPIVHAPAVNGAVVIALRGDDYALTVGRDFSIGYADHDKDVVRLYLCESFTFQVLTPEAAVPLTYPATGS
ncbi:MAG: family 1 encapsulin nanocompartment shell protein [Rhodospirillales bacterium]